MTPSAQFPVTPYNYYLLERFRRFLKRSSQRPYKLPKDEGLYVHLAKRGLNWL